MSRYKLRSDETKILTCTQARRCGDDREQACVELTLTNRNLIYVWQIRKMFGKGTEHEDVYPLSRLKVLDGVVQAKYAEKNDLAVLDLFFATDEVSFVFETGDKYSSRKLVAQWLDAISQVTTGLPSSQAAELRKTIPSVEMLAGAIKGTFDVFAKTFTGKTMDSQENTEEQVTVKCIGCRAPISGRSGMTIQCRYCDTTQTLK